MNPIEQKDCLFAEASQGPIVLAGAGRGVLPQTGEPRSRRRLVRRRTAVIGLGLLGLLITMGAVPPPNGPGAGPTFGPWSLLPAVVALGLAFATGQVLPSLFSGVVAGSIVLFAHSGRADDLNFIDRFFLPALGSRSYATILLVYLWFLGGILGIWGKTGAAGTSPSTLGPGSCGARARPSSSPGSLASCSIRGGP